MEQRAVITGMGVFSALGDTPAALFAALCHGGSALREIEGPAVPGCHCHLAGRIPDFDPAAYLPGRPLRPLDRTSQLASIACGWALESSGWTSERRLSKPLDMVLGTMFSGMHTISDFDRTALVSGPASVSPMAFANTVLSAAAGQTAIWHGLRGVNSTVATGSISGLTALGHAAESVRLGSSEAILGGGVEEFSLESFCGFARAGLLCTNGTAPERPIPFDRGRNGFALGEGAGFLVLESANFAQTRGARILAEVKSYAAAFDSTQGREPGRSVQILARTMAKAIERAGLTPSDIDFVSASANGSPKFDAIELEALAQVFCERADDLPVTAVKGSLGEGLAAAGPVQVMAAVETLLQGRLPGIAGLFELPDGCRMRGLHAGSRDIYARSCLINGVGLDGNYCSLILALPDLDSVSYQQSPH